MFGLMKSDIQQSRDLLMKQAEVLALALEVKKVRFFEIGALPNQDIFSARMVWCSTPSILRNDYRLIKEKATRLRTRLKPR
jgi:hypothetical protein